MCLVGLKPLPHQQKGQRDNRMDPKALYVNQALSESLHIFSFASQIVLYVKLSMYRDNTPKKLSWPNLRSIHPHSFPLASLWVFQSRS